MWYMNYPWADGDNPLSTVDGYCTPHSNELCTQTVQAYPVDFSSIIDWYHRKHSGRCSIYIQLIYKLLPNYCNAWCIAPAGWNGATIDSTWGYLLYMGSTLGHLTKQPFTPSITVPNLPLSNKQNTQNYVYQTLNITISDSGCGTRLCCILSFPLECMTVRYTVVQ